MEETDPKVETWRWGVWTRDRERGGYTFVHDDDASFEDEPCLSYVEYGSNVQNREDRVCVLEFQPGYEEAGALIEATPQHLAQIAAVPRLLRACEKAERFFVGLLNVWFMRHYESVRTGRDARLPRQEFMEEAGDAKREIRAALAAAKPEVERVDDGRD